MIHELESLVRAGKSAEARKRIREVTFKKLARDELAIYANLARRLGLPELSLRLLNPIVRGEKSPFGRTASNAATIQERIEYAAALRTLGALPEAVQLLTEMSPEENPLAAFQLALCLISEWRYDRAIPLLSRYVRAPAIPSYSLHVARVNLLEALIHEAEFKAASLLLDELQSADDLTAFPILVRKCEELRAQLEISEGRLDSAIRRLGESLNREREQPDTVQRLLIRKWLETARSLQAGAVTPGLLEVREEALALRAWETVRDCDYQRARIGRDAELLNRLYFGTPYESFRRRVLECGGSRDDLPERFLWSDFPAKKSREVFDLSTGATSEGTSARNARLTAGQALHRLLILLCQDFYRPVPLLSIFSKLFPGEHFNPASSVNRVHHITGRFRRWIQDHGLPLQLVEISGSYRLGFTDSFAIAIPREPLSLDGKELEFLRLRSCVGETEFPARLAISRMGLSRATVCRLLKWGVEAGKLECLGRNRSIRYRRVA